jgi:peptide/nickel transport system substrate-binding protein
MKRAEKLEAVNPLAGDRLWTRVEHKLVDQAPWVPLIIYRTLDFVSKRVGNYEYNPQWRVLIDQLWVR